jgi:replicative DNA helicase Mcm
MDGRPMIYNEETFAEDLAKKYPKMFPRGVAPVSVGKGWFHIVEAMCGEIQRRIDWKQEQHEKYGNGNGCEQVVVQQIKEKFGCYDSETEVLTESGWRYFSEVTPTDKFATLSPSGYLEYQHSSDLISYEYCGKMYRLSARGIDLLVTPNHRMFWAKGNSFGRYATSNTKQHPMVFETPDKKFRKPKRFLKGCLWQGEPPITTFTIPGYSYSNATPTIQLRTYTKPDLEVDATAFLKLLGMIVSEGYISKHEDEVAIAACNDGTEKACREQSDWEEVLTHCGFKYTKTGAETTAVVYRIYSTRLSRWCKEHIKCGAANKRVPGFVKQLPPHQIRVFLDYLYKGDGHKSKSAHTLYTISKQLSDDVQELLLKVGSAFSHHITPPRKNGLIKGAHDCHCINWLKNISFNIEAKTIKGKNYTEEWVDYTGKVYCATVPNGTLYVRRNGKGVWCGNSLRFYCSPTDEETFGMIRLAEIWASHTCEQCGNPGERRDVLGWLSTLCDHHYKERLAEREAREE